MAVAEAKKMEKGEEGAAPGVPAWLTGRLAGPLGWGPRKLGELRSFLSEVKSELKKVTWPARPEVVTTTIVVVVTTVFFGFYLWGADLVFSWLLSLILKK
jgi:preprotein translocase subunit SecE